ncbi:MAG TPA: PAS domain S-box protein [Candidatus Dormibacteraeota bacterium]
MIRPPRLRELRSEDSAHDPLTDLRSIVAGAPMVLFTCDASGVCTFADGRMLERLGLDPAMLVGQNLLTLFNERAQRTAALDQALPALWSPAQAVSGQVDLNGRVIGFSRAPVRGEAGELLGVVGVAFDATEDISTVEAGRDVDERFRTIFNDAPMGMAIVDTAGRCVQVNHALCEMLQRSCTDLVGHRLAAPECDLVAARGVAWPLEPGRRAEAQLRRADGATVHALVDATVLHRHGGEVTHHLLHIQDFTLRRELDEAMLRQEAWLRALLAHALRSERARTEAEARLLAVVNTAPVAVFVFDARGVITMAAGRCLSYLGMGGDELIGLSVFDAELSRLDLTDRVRVALEGDEVRAVVIRDEHAFDVWFGSIHHGDMIVGGFGIANDITELYRADQERRRLLSQLVTAQEAERTRIAYDVHDDSLQAMTAIGIRLEQLKRRLTSPRDLDLIGCIDATLADAVRRLRALLLELGPPRLDGAGLSSAIADHARRGLEGTPTRVMVEDELTAEPDQECSIVVYRIAQEALANVRKHAAAATVRIRLESVDEGVLASIDDDGVGFTIAKVRHDAEPGHLGMTSMRERAEIAGGWLLLSSHPGCGTTVRYWIPCGPGSHAADGLGQRSGEATTPSRSAMATASRRECAPSFWMTAWT